MGQTLAIHWIATTRGTRLHGDVRESWRNGRLLGPDPFGERAIRDRMAHGAAVLSRDEQDMVAAALGETVRQQRHQVHAATVCPTHRRVVFAPLAEDVRTGIARLKKRSANVVLAARRRVGHDRRHLGTAGPFPVFILDVDHLHNAAEYVRRHDRRMGRAADPYDCLLPADSDARSG